MRAIPDPGAPVEDLPRPRVIHAAVPGRVRFEVPGLYREPARCERLDLDPGSLSAILVTHDPAEAETAPWAPDGDRALARFLSKADAALGG